MGYWAVEIVCCFYLTSLNLIFDEFYRMVLILKFKFYENDIVSDQDLDLNYWLNTNRYRVGQKRYSKSTMQ